MVNRISNNQNSINTSNEINANVSNESSEMSRKSKIIIGIAVTIIGTLIGATFGGVLGTCTALGAGVSLLIAIPFILGGGSLTGYMFAGGAYFLLK